CVSPLRSSSPPSLLCATSLSTMKGDYEMSLHSLMNPQSPLVLVRPFSSHTHTHCPSFSPFICLSLLPISHYPPVTHPCLCLFLYRVLPAEFAQMSFHLLSPSVHVCPCLYQFFSFAHHFVLCISLISLSLSLPPSLSQSLSHPPSPSPTLPLSLSPSLSLSLSPFSLSLSESWWTAYLQLALMEDWR